MGEMGQKWGKWDKMGLKCTKLGEKWEKMGKMRQKWGKWDKNGGKWDEMGLK